MIPCYPFQTRSCSSVFSSAGSGWNKKAKYPFYERHSTIRDYVFQGAIALILSEPATQNLYDDNYNDFKKISAAVSVARRIANKDK
jgi:hypothetical protein